MTPDAACLSIETSPEWMEMLIQVVKQHGVLIGDHEHDLVYDLRDEDDEAQFRGLYSQEGYEKERTASRPLVDAIAQSPFASALIEKGENWFLVTRIEEKDPDIAMYSLSSGAKGKEVDMWGMGPLKDLLDTLAPYGVTSVDSWSPVHMERKDWLTRTQQQEDAMVEQTAPTMKPQWGSLPQDGSHVRVILPGAEGAGQEKEKMRRNR